MTCHSAGEWGFQGKGDVSAGRLGIRAGHNCSESHSLPRPEMKEEQLIFKEIENNNNIKKECVILVLLYRGNDFVKNIARIANAVQCHS